MILLINASSKLPTDANDFVHAKKKQARKKPSARRETRNNVGL